MISLETLTDTCADLGVPHYRAVQVYEALTRRFAISFDEVTGLPRDLRAALADRLSPVSLAEVDRSVSADGRTRKALLVTDDGAAIEAVLLLSASRATACVSTQVGCAVRCAFCASGADGLRRDLTAEEIVEQVLHFARELREQEKRVTNVVFMGMGEPFFNYDETLRACRMLNDPAGFGLAARGISVSTAGVVPAITRFTGEPMQLNLAVSLHAATDELREQLVPLNRRYPLDTLFAACKDYVTATRRKLFFEWVLLSG